MWFLSTPVWAYVLFSACHAPSETGAAVVVSFPFLGADEAHRESAASKPYSPRCLLGDRAACALFMLGWTVQYGASAVWHRWPWVERQHEILANNADHVGIFVMIACSYAVPCALALPTTGQILASGLWFVALVGSLKTCGVLGSRGNASALAGLYVSMGSLFLLSVREMADTFTLDEQRWAIASLVQYFISACIYVSKRPDPWPKHWGCHECFHFFVCSGSACTFMTSLRIVQRTTGARAAAAALFSAAAGSAASAAS